MAPAETRDVYLSSGDSIAMCDVIGIATLLLENLFILLPPSEEEDRGLEANQGSGHSPTRRPHIANASILGSQGLYFDLNRLF